MKQPMQVLTSQKTVEWYTPPAFIEDVRAVLGVIDCDPASHTTPQSWIQARTFYTESDNGLAHEWHGKVFLNPPFSGTRIWVDKLKRELIQERATEAILLTNSAPGYVWWEEMIRFARVTCLVRDRMRFVNSEGVIAGQAKKGQSVFYFGHNSGLFQTIFLKYGRFL